MVNYIDRGNLPTVPRQATALCCGPSADRQGAAAEMGKSESGEEGRMIWAERNARVLVGGAGVVLL